MTNSDLYKEWIERYARRISKKSNTGDKPDDKQDSSGSGLPDAGRPPIGNINFKSAFFLEKEFGRQVDAEVHKRYPNIPAIDNVKYNEEKKVVVGSNPFYVSAVSEVLQENNLAVRPATQAELEKIAQGNLLPLKGNYWEDSALVWRSNPNPNEYLAQDLFEQCKNQGINLQEGHAYVFPLHALRLKNNANSPHKLSFVLRNPGVYFEAQILMSKSESYIDSSKMDGNGLPLQVFSSSVSDSGNRQLWTRNSSLSGLFLGRDLGVGSGSVYLAVSDELGRVVCISGEAARPEKLG